MLLDWALKENELNSIKDNQGKSIHITRRVGNAGNKCHAQLDERLFSWFIERSNKNLQIKDKFIRIKALSIAKEYPELSTFKASNRFLENFKSCHNINLELLPVVGKSLMMLLN